MLPTYTWQQRSLRAPLWQQRSRSTMAGGGCSRTTRRLIPRSPASPLGGSYAAAASCRRKIEGNAVDLQHETRPRSGCFLRTSRHLMGERRQLLVTAAILLFATPQAAAETYTVSNPGEKWIVLATATGARHLPAICMHASSLDPLAPCPRSSYLPVAQACPFPRSCCHQPPKLAPCLCSCCHQRPKLAPCPRSC